MKNFATVLFLILISSGLHAQNNNNYPPQIATWLPQQEQHDIAAITLFSPALLLLADTGKKVQSLDTVLFDMYGNLRVDDPLYNKKAPWYVPALHIIGQEVLLNVFDQYVLKLEFARISLNSWSRNATAGAPWGDGWRWDEDRFGNNFFFHPYTGVGYFNAARASGYSFWEAVPYTFAGSYLWKTFGENGTPEREDLVNTTIGGMFGGEILYRLSSNALDDRTTGTERVIRETIAGILSPVRFATRLMDGKLCHVTDQEVYKKEPLNVTLLTGIHKVNDDNKFFTGQTSELLNVQFDYGNPFELIDRKPFDFFKGLAELNFGVGRKIIDNVTGYGLLAGNNSSSGKLDLLSGLFQNFDYWDSRGYELAMLGFGGGVIARYPVFTSASFYSTLHVALVPFGANNFAATPSDTAQFRDYNFGGGAEAKLESTLSFGNHASFKLVANYYWFHTYVGEPGNNLIAIVRPRITIGILDNLSIGLEHSIYSSTRDSPDFATIHTIRTEQKLFLMLFIEDSQRGGHYN
jgi:hypothetical protein